MFNSLKKYQLFWNIIYQISKIIPKRLILKKTPVVITLEPTNSCNLRCPVCPTHFAMTRKRGIMKFELFKNVINELKPLQNKPAIHMNFSGEPLLNKDIAKFVDYANNNGHYTFISTNVTKLDKELARELLTSGLSEIHLCIDGFTKDSHENYRIGSSFTEVKKNIETFMAIKNNMKNKTTAVIQTLLTSYSENDIDEMIQWAKELGAEKINFKTFSMGSYTDKAMKKKYSHFLPKQSKFLRKTTSIYHTLCGTPRSTALIYWNGVLGLCCVDFDDVIKMPNINNKSFISTFNSKEVITKRYSGFQKKLKLCKVCSSGNADYMGMIIDLKKQETN